MLIAAEYSTEAGSQIAWQGAIFLVRSGMFRELSNSPEKPLPRATQGATQEWRQRIYDIIFGHDTRSGKAFDVALLVAILASIVVVMLDSVASIRQDHSGTLVAIEWALTIGFTVEYIVRIVSSRKRRRYIFSFYGIVDLVSVLPTYLSLLVPGGEALITLRALRLLRVFRVLKLSSFLREANTLNRALRASVRKIVVFLGVVLTLSVIMGTMMYLIEGAKNGFTSIPRSMYWAIVTMTTVGYGDIAPQTIPGQVLASLVMIMGYGIIAVPTGIVSAELVHSARQEATTRMAVLCLSCKSAGHDKDANFCKHCGASF